MLADVLDHGQLAGSGGMPAAAHAGGDGNAVDRLAVAGRQAGCGMHPQATLFEQHDGDQHLRVDLLQAAGHVAQGFLQWSLRQHAVQHCVAGFLHGLAAAPLLNVADAAAQAEIVLLAGGQADGDPVRVAIGIAQAQLAEPGAGLAREDGGYFARGLLPLVLVDEVEQRPAQALVDAVAGDDLPGRVDERQAPVAVGEEDRLVQLLDQLAVTRLAAFQLLVGQVLLAEVDVDAVHL